MNCSLKAFIITSYLNITEHIKVVALKRAVLAFTFDRKQSVGCWSSLGGDDSTDASRHAVDQRGYLFLRDSVPFLLERCCQVCKSGGPLCSAQKSQTELAPHMLDRVEVGTS